MKTTIKKMYGLALACVMLFGINAANAQDAGKKEKETKEKEKKKLTRIVIIKDEDGKTVKIDTSVVGNFYFDSGDFNFDFEMPEIPDLAGLPEPPVPPGAFFYHWEDDENLSPEERENLKKEMENVRKELQRTKEEMKHLKSDEFKKEMEELRKQMKNLRIEIEREKEKDGEKTPGEKGEKKMMLYRMNNDGSNGSGLFTRKSLLMTDDDTSLANCLKKCEIKCSKDSISMQKCIQLVYDEEDNASAEPGMMKRKVVVIERSKPMDEETVAAIADETAAPEENKTSAPVAEIKNERNAAENNSSQLQAEDLNFFPNPSDGKFSLSFRLNTTGTTSIRLIDAVGKEIFNETIENFTGEYNRQFDISGKAKGTYLLMISQGNKWMHKKLVVK